MYNDLFTIGRFTIHGYGLMIAIGIIAAYAVAELRARKKGLEDKYIFPLLVWGVVIGFVCAKILYYITILDEIRSDPRIMLNIFDGFVVYGGIIGGILAGYCFCRIKKIISGSGSAVHCAGPGLRKAWMLPGGMLLRGRDGRTAGHCLYGFPVRP